MNVLGISFSGHHESAACRVQDGELVLAADGSAHALKRPYDQRPFG